jgi:putative flippase GtrA
MSLWAHARQMSSFGVIGTIGFLTDAVMLTLLHNLLGAGVLPARLCSFAVAVTVTWSLNRRLTFPGRDDDRALRQWLRYSAVNGVGALLNLAVFLYLIYRIPDFAAVPLIPLAVASLIAMVFNFFASKYIAFRATSAWRIPR